MLRVVCVDGQLEVPPRFADESALFRKYFGETIQVPYECCVLEALFAIYVNSNSIAQMNLARFPLLLNAANFVGSARCIDVLLQAMMKQCTQSILVAFTINCSHLSPST